MNFLIDEQLPRALCGWLRDRRHEAVHVEEVGFRGQSDLFLRHYARQRNLVIVTKDEDHVFPPEGRVGLSVVWVRVGNAVNRVLLARLDEVWADVEAALERGDPLVIIFPTHPPS